MIANSFSRPAKFLVERKATSVVACVSWRFTCWSVRMCAHQVGFSLEASRCGFHSARLENFFSCPVERFAFPVFVDFRVGRYVIRCVLLSVLSHVLECLLQTCPSDQQKCWESNDQRSLFARSSSVGARLRVSPSWLGVVTRWSPQYLVCKRSCKKKVLISSPAIFDRDVCVRYGDNVHRFLSLWSLGPHRSGGSSRHDCQHFRAIRIHCCGRDTSSVVAHVYWDFRFSSLTMCASKLAIVLRRFDVVATAPRWEHFCMTSICVPYVRGFPFWSARDLICVMVRVFICIGVSSAGPP